MLFLKFSNINILFNKKTLIYRFYIINKALFTIKQAWIINKTDFTIIILNANSKTFIIYMAI